MSQAAIPSKTNPESSEYPFKRERYRQIIRISLLSTLVIFCIETIVMILLEYFLSIPPALEVFIDGLLLVTILFPLNYYFIIKPMAFQIEQNYFNTRELKKSSAMLERFFSINDVLIAYMDINFNLIRVNQAFARANQGEPEVFIGRNFFDYLRGKENQEIFFNVIQSGTPYTEYEKTLSFFRNPANEANYWDLNIFPIKNNEGHVIEMLLTMNNVTSRKNAQMALVDFEYRFRVIFNQTFQQSALLDASGCVVVANQTALDFTGLPENDITGLPLWQIPWWDEPASITANLQADILQAAEGAITRSEHRIRARGGETAVVDMTIKPIHDKHGRTTLLLYEARDITDRILANEALKRGEEKIQLLYDAEKQAHHFAETLRNIGLDLYRSLNSNTVLETLLEHLLKVTPYTSAHIMRFSDENRLVVRMANGEADWPENEKLLNRIFESSDLPGLQPLLIDSQIISIPDTLVKPNLQLFPNPQFVRSWLGIPLTAGEQLISICILEHNQPNFFTEKLIGWSTALTSQASIAIQNAWLFERVRDNRERLQALSRRLVEIQEMERRYIAQELHDEAGQALASMMVGLRLIERDRFDPEAVAARSLEIKHVADGVLEDLHRLAMDLRPATLDHLGLVAAIRQHTEMVSDRHNLTVQFETVGKITRLPSEFETAIYRIVQEGLTNVVRHSRATRADVLLEKRNQSLVLVIEDNGIGFDPQTPKVGQLGMLGMRERADMLGGRLLIESSAKQGTTVMLEVPWPSESL